MPKKDIRKQVYHLSSQDLFEHPLWEFCSDEEGVEGQDEATVKPSEDAEVPSYSPGAYIVAADVTYADGTHADGYVYSGEPDDFGCITPSIVLPSGHINLWLGSLQSKHPWKEHLANSVDLLGNKIALFPMSFQTRVNVNGSPLAFILEGFLLRDLDGRIITVE